MNNAINDGDAKPGENDINSWNVGTITALKREDLPLVIGRGLDARKG